MCYGRKAYQEKGARIHYKTHIMSNYKREPGACMEQSKERRKQRDNAVKTKRAL
jgi:hypothetical protein